MERKRNCNTTQIYEKYIFTPPPRFLIRKTCPLLHLLTLLIANVSIRAELAPLLRHLNSQSVNPVFSIFDKTLLNFIARCNVLRITLLNIYLNPDKSQRAKSETKYRRVTHR